MADGTRTVNERVRPARAASLVLWLALAGGLLAGLVYAAALSFRIRALHQFTFTPSDVVWMAPIADVALFLVLAAPIALVLGRTHRRWTTRIGLFVIAMALAMSLVLPISILHPAATLIIAAGIATRIVAMLEARPDVWRARLARGSAVLAAVTIACTCVVRVSPVLRERRAMASLPAPAAGAPNVLLLILDTVKASNMSFYGYARSTSPSIDSLAPTSTVFDWAISPASWTLPSHGSMFTGRRASDLTTHVSLPLDDRDSTLAEVFAQRGYATGGFVANLLFTIPETGLDRGFARYESYTTSVRSLFWSATLAQTPVIRRLVRMRDPKGALRGLLKLDLQLQREPEQARKRAPRVVDEFLGWQRGLDGRPFFAFLNLFDAHEPFPPPEPYASRFSKHPKFLDWYDGGIAYEDAQVGRLLATLRRRGVLDNTIIVVTSDHGHSMGEAGHFGHGKTVYLPTLHVPLLVRWPAHVREGVRVAEQTSLRDLGATLLDLAAGGAQGFPGTSFASALQGGAYAPAAALAEVRSRGGPAAHDGASSVVWKGLHYIRIGQRREELYDITADPLELRNLAADSANTLAMSDLRARLDRSLASK